MGRYIIGLFLLFFVGTANMPATPVMHQSIGPALANFSDPPAPPSDPGPKPVA